SSGQLYGDPSQLTSSTQRNWQDQAGDFVISGGKVAGNSVAMSYATLAGNIADGSAQADIVIDPAAGQQVGVVLRASASGFYAAQIMSTGTGYVANIYRFSGGVFTQLNATSATFVPSGGTDTIRFEAQGPSLKLFFNGALLTYAFDSTFTTG